VNGRGNLRFLVHNLVAHPLAGLAWFVGAERLGDWIHDFGEIG
jgi:hypothetical protein